MPMLTVTLSCRCLGALGEWERLALVANDLWHEDDTEGPDSTVCAEYPLPQSGTLGGPYRSLEETAQTPTSSHGAKACRSSSPFSRLGGSQEALNSEAPAKRSSPQRGPAVGFHRPQKRQGAGRPQSHLAEKRRETASLAASAAFHFRDWRALQRCVQWFPVSLLRTALCSSPRCWKPVPFCRGRGRVACAFCCAAR